MKALLHACVAACVVPMALSVSGCTGRPSTSTPLCVDDFEANTTLTVKLDTVYDPTSEFLYDGSLEPYFHGVGGGRATSCGESDGWTTGAVVSFSLAEPHRTEGAVCVPWSAAVQPEAISSLEPNAIEATPIPGVTIAQSLAAGMLAGADVSATRALFAPTKDSRGPSIPRQLPALVVSRRLTIGGRDCYDAWVASWQ